MNHARLASVLLGPHLSEKSSTVADNVVVFKVLLNATKEEITEAVKHFFKVDVKSVNTVKNKGKQRGVRNRKGYQADVKKAYVTLGEGQVINFEDFAA